MNISLLFNEGLSILVENQRGMRNMCQYFIKSSFTFTAQYITVLLSYPPYYLVMT